MGGASGTSRRSSGCAGPTDVRGFCQFLPSGSAFRPLVQLTRFFAGQEYDFDVQLILKAAEVPRASLGGRRAGAAARLVHLAENHGSLHTMPKMRSLPATGAQATQGMSSGEERGVA